MAWLSRNALPERKERALQKALEALREQRRTRFRILACIDGSEESFLTVGFAARLGKGNECDIILLYVRPLDQGLQSGGLQVRVARQNMLEWGVELPGVKDLKNGLEILKGEGISPEDWSHSTAHADAWGDPLGDNKVEYCHENGRVVVLKLKTAPEPASGILDQYELGPYNLMILGEPSRWRGEFRAWFDAGIVQKVVTLAPCSVLVARNSLDKTGFFICTDGSSRSTEAVKRAAVLAHHVGQPITLFSVSDDDRGSGAARENVENGKALLRRMGISVAETKIASGDPVQQIVSHGSPYQLIVVSHRGQSRLHRMFRGSISYDVIRHAATSVLNVR